MGSDNNNAFGGEKQNKKSNGQTFVTLTKSLWNHSFMSTIAWPHGCKYGTIAYYEEGWATIRPKQQFVPNCLIDQLITNLLKVEMKEIIKSTKNEFS